MAANGHGPRSEPRAGEHLEALRRRRDLAGDLRPADRFDSLRRRTRWPRWVAAAAKRAGLEFGINGEMADEQWAQLVTEVGVPDLDPTLAFLLELGFVLQRRTGGFAVLRWDDSLLFVAEDPKAVTGPRWMNVRVIVPDVDAMWRKAAGMHAKVVNPIGDRPYGL